MSAMTHVPRPARGLTLVELMVALAMLAVLGLMAVPSLGGMLARHRVQAAASQLGLDLGDSRHEAARRGGKVYVNFQSGSDWCYVVALDPAATCASDGERVLKRVTGRQHPGVSLNATQAVVFDGATGLGPPAPAKVHLASARGDVLDVQVSLLGRARVCAPDGALKTFPRC